MNEQLHSKCLILILNCAVYVIPLWWTYILNSDLRLYLRIVLSASGMLCYGHHTGKCLVPKCFMMGSHRTGQHRAKVLVDSIGRVFQL